MREKKEREEEKVGVVRRLDPKWNGLLLRATQGVSMTCDSSLYYALILVLVLVLVLVLRLVLVLVPVLVPILVLVLVRVLIQH